MKKKWIAEIRRGYLSRSVIATCETSEQAHEAILKYRKENPSALGPVDFYNVSWAWE